MKTPTLLIVLAVGLTGCGSKSPYDITADQIKQRADKGHFTVGGPPPDLNHLPPGAVKHEYIYKKGDTLPDGTIADHARKVVNVEMPKGGKLHGEEIVTQDK